ncbi:MAG: condensation domain-containing protein, partial [Flavobacterium sp.]
MTVLSGINALLNRYTGQDDIIIGTPIAGREHPDLENQLGLYLNTLAIRTSIEKHFNFLDLVKREKQVLLGAYEHQSYPFANLVGKLNFKRDTSRSALFDVMMDIKNQSQIINNEELINLEVKNYEFENKTSKNDLNFAFSETDELVLSIEYNTDIYDKQFIEQMFAHFEILLMQLIQHPEAPICKLSYLKKEEEHQLWRGFNDTAVAYPKGLTLIDLFSAQVAKAPDDVAVQFANATLTYKELDELSNQLAFCLKKIHSISQGDMVGVQLKRSEWVIISILGVLKAGGVYIPIDSDLPSKRKSFIIEDTQLKLLITEAEYVLDLTFYKGNTFAIDVEFVPSDHDSSALTFANNESDLAYIIYTSGSTGQPKG